VGIATITTAYQIRPLMKRNLAAWFWYSILWCPCYALSQLLFRYRFWGKGNVPISGPVLLVSNHQSHLDPVLVGLACPRQLKYLARKGLFFFPFNLWIRALGAVPIDQERSALAGLRTTLNLLKENNAVLVFPEGSRTPDGQLHKMFPGFCLLARRSQATIVPLAVEGAFAALPRGSLFIRPRSIGLTFGTAIPPQQYAQFSDDGLTALVSEHITRALDDTRRELLAAPRSAGILPRKRENSLLAGQGETVVTGKAGI
jgi:1-acyl-sn-glycerol-3-phosphate acyltransferase